MYICLYTYIYTYVNIYIYNYSYSYSSIAIAIDRWDQPHCLIQSAHIHALSIRQQTRGWLYTQLVTTALFKYALHRRLIYKGDTSTHAEGTDPQ